MQFEQLVNIVLKEPLVEKIRPVFDGEEQRYITYVSSINQSTRGPFRCGNVVSDDYDMYANEYIKEVCYQGTSFTHAFGAYVQALKELNVSPHVIDDARHEAWRLSELDDVATFKVCVLPTTVYIKVNINHVYARVRDIHKQLKGVDTTGLEDLL